MRYVGIGAIALLMMVVAPPVQADWITVYASNWDGIGESFQLGYAVAFLDGIVVESPVIGQGPAKTIVSRLGQCVRQKSITPAVMKAMISDHLQRTPDEKKHTVYLAAIHALARICQ